MVTQLIIVSLTWEPTAQCLVMYQAAVLNLLMHVQFLAHIVTNIPQCFKEDLKHQKLSCEDYIVKGNQYIN